MPTAIVEAAQENLCDVADAIRGLLAEIHDRLDRLEDCQSEAEKRAESSGLAEVLGTCRSEADSALARIDGIAKRIGHL